MTAIRLRSACGRPVAASRPSAALCAVVFCVTWALPAWAEDDSVVDTVPPDGQQSGAVGPEQWVNLGENFDANIFSMRGPGFRPRFVTRRDERPRAGTPAPTRPADAPDESSTLVRLRQLGEARIDRLASMPGLSETQRRTLRLAMESDIHRLAEEIDVDRRKYQDVEVNLAHEAGQDQFAQVQEDVQRWQSRLLTVFDADCLFAKALQTTLDPDQMARLTFEQDARRTAIWKGLIAIALLKFDELMGLDQKQHAELEQLLLERQPPLRLEGFTSGNRNLQRVIVWIVLAEIGPERLRAAGLSAAQEQAVMQYANDGKDMRIDFEEMGLLQPVSP